jgi:beta-galactosidase
MDGLVFSDRTPTPGLIEYKKAIEPVHVVSGSYDRVQIINRYDMISLDHLKCRWLIISDGSTIEGGEVAIPKNIEPGHTAEIMINGISRDMLRNKGETYLQVVFSLKEPTVWAPKDHEIACSRLCHNELLRSRRLTD